MSAFDIIETIHERFFVLISAGTIYPRLESLEKLGLVSNKHDGRRKVFYLTEKGRELIDNISEEYDLIHTSLVTLLTR